jgi:hypothetical protein
MTRWGSSTSFWGETGSEANRCSFSASPGSGRLAELDRQIAGLGDERNPTELLWISRAAFWVDRVSECRSALWRIVESGRTGGAVASALSALVHLGYEAFSTGRWDEAIELVTEGQVLTTVVAARLSAHTVVPLHYEGWTHFTQGAHELRAAFAGNGISDRLALAEPGIRITV